ncbi:MAG TPA: hypothetical protein VKY89_08355 [Thermoanaerobaculia bacterium]|jgi:hypothetical protein|nr:hypothetical protein [Thermoanaerobaculia bacterium]
MKRKGLGWLAAVWVGVLICGGPPAAVAATAVGPSPQEHPQSSALVRLSSQLGLKAMTAQAGSDCTGGIIYDDGGFEDATAVPVANGLLVMSFDLPANTSGIQQLCVALTRLSTSASPDLPFNAVFYAADGPSGIPGTLLASVPATATAVPASNGGTVSTQFYSVSIGSALTLPATRTIYAGVQFDGTQQFFVGIDTSATTALRPAYVSNDGGTTWLTETSQDPNQNAPYRAFGIRIVPTLAQTNCVPTTTAMCLQGNRFQVQATFQAPGSATGQAQTVPLTTDSGYLWFFESTNIEAVVKVIDACALNQHFWVFAGGLTNVHTSITVTDTQTGASKTYMNPQNTAFQPLQDTSALPCP